MHISHVTRFAKKFGSELRQVTTPRIILALVFAVAAYTYKYFVGGGISRQDIPSAIFPLLWVVCLFGSYYAIRAAMHLRREDIAACKSYKPTIHLVGESPEPKKPTPLPWLVTPAAVIALCGVVVYLTITFPIDYWGQQRIIFKSAPQLNIVVRGRIIMDVNAFCRYLDNIGFETPTRFPPLEVVPGEMQGGFVGGSGNVFEDKLFIGSANLGNTVRIRHVYAAYFFETVFHPGDISDDAERFNWLTSDLYARYFVASSVGELRDDPPLSGEEDEWLNVLWQIRQKYGQSFTDSALFYAAKTIRPKARSEQTFNEFFGNRFMYGVSMVDNFSQNAPGISEILKNQGLCR